MKKRTAVIGALVSLLPMGQPLVIGGGAALTSAAVMLSVPEKVNAQTKNFICEDLETYTGSAKDLKTLNNETWYLTIKEKEFPICTKALPIRDKCIKTVLIKTPCFALLKKYHLAL